MAKRRSGLDGKRIRALRILKGFGSQQAFADRIGVPQSHISDLEKGRLRSPSVFLRVADLLDCTTDFLFERGQFRLSKGASGLRAAASHMAFDVFATRLEEEHTENALIWTARCRRVMAHAAAPLTAQAWFDLAEHIELAVGPEGLGPGLRDVSARKAG